MSFFSSIKEEPKESYPLDKFLDFLNVRQDSDMSVSDAEMASSHAPFFWMRKLETELPSTGGSQGIQMFTSTLLPAIGLVVHALPEIIQRSVKACDLFMSRPALPLPTSLLA